MPIALWAEKQLSTMRPSGNIPDRILAGRVHTEFVANQSVIVNLQERHSWNGWSYQLDQLLCFVCLHVTLLLLKRWMIDWLIDWKITDRKTWIYFSQRKY